MGQRITEMRAPELRGQVGTYQGGCDCGAVRYELQIDDTRDDVAIGMDALIVRAREFKLLCGEDALSGHQFGARDVHDFYCERCGVRSFTRRDVERADAAFYAVHVLRLDAPAPLCC